MVVIPLFISMGDIEFTLLLCAAHLISSILSLYDASEEGEGDSFQEEEAQSSKLFRGFSLSPAQLVLLSFSGVIFLGTFY